MIRWRRLGDVVGCGTFGLALGACAGGAEPPAPTGTPPPAASQAALPDSASPVATARAAGDLRPELFVSDLAFIPGRQDVAFIVTGKYPEDLGPTVFVQAVDELGQPREAARALGTLPAPARWIQDITATHAGNRLAILASTAEEAPSDENDVWLMSGDGSTITGLEVGDLRPGHIELSPDGKRLAILTGQGELVVLDLATGDRKYIASDLFGAYGGPGADFAFSPDGGQLALVSEHSGEGWWLDLIDVASATRREIARSAASVDGLAFSPEGDHLFFAATSPPPAGTDEGDSGPQPSLLYRVDLSADAEPTPLANVSELTGGDGAVVWMAMHPNGRQLLLQQGDHLYVDDIEGGRAEQVTPPGFALFSRPIVTTVGGQSWLAYMVYRDLGTASPYNDAQGNRLDAMSEIRVQPLD
jgi:dipeptidyl aminopeptidase/acylaminoacyl peptidase